MLRDSVAFYCRQAILQSRIQVLTPDNSHGIFAIHPLDSN